jgi:hypothetical protein
MDNTNQEESMTRKQIIEAVAQARSHCRLQEEIGEFTPISLRGVLYTLGYDSYQAECVIRFVAAQGFNYCVDPWITNPSGERPPEFTCYWGPDQLRSRLDSIHIEARA